MPSQEPCMPEWPRARTGCSFVRSMWQVESMRVHHSVSCPPIRLAANFVRNPLLEVIPVDFAGKPASWNAAARRCALADPTSHLPSTSADSQPGQGTVGSSDGLAFSPWSQKGPARATRDTISAWTVFRKLHPLPMALSSSPSTLSERHRSRGRTPRPFYGVARPHGWW